ncbi:DUF2642 domain-containing protein [Rossellomorea vietnamensis]|uniref:DUF2642 domain-containing protein n=1 Tax=Rossellomorea vietnamensis TaxID=218284 RepID=A0ACD4C4E2_9BACI|nr:DUF2642 domain-containing protein [Rossellomorea vietnamensis]UXH43129.1 DUF2642 domain-containing protein [Rossellomorea vietnamensis]
MKNVYSAFTGEAVMIELTGKKVINGFLIEVGSEVMIVYNGDDYIYISTSHIKSMSVVSKDSIGIDEPSVSPQLEQEDQLSLRKILTTAKGVFLEIYTTGNQSIHGYITGIMNNYFAFYSPVYKTMYISLQHLKWLIPYSTNLSPYRLSKENLPVNPSNSITLARSFEVQLEKLSGHLVVLNLGVQEEMIGKIERVSDNIMELITAKGESTYLNMQHIQTIHLP